MTSFVGVEVSCGFLGGGACGEGEAGSSFEFYEAYPVGEDGGCGLCDARFTEAREHEFDEGLGGDAFAELCEDRLGAVHVGMFQFW